MQLFLKVLGGMSVIVNPDQTAPSGAVWSGSALFAYTLLSETLVYEILGHLLYSEIHFSYNYFSMKTGVVVING